MEQGPNGQWLGHLIASTISPPSTSWIGKVAGRGSVEGEESAELDRWSMGGVEAGASSGEGAVFSMLL